MRHVHADQEKNTSNAMVNSDKPLTPDIVIFGAGIAGLWTFHRLKRMGYDVLLLEHNAIGGGQSIASQGIIHSGLKFSLAGKVNKLAQSISNMPQRWRDALNNNGDVDLSRAKIAAHSQNLMIPRGFLGGITKVITQKTLGDHVRDIPHNEWPEHLKNCGFNGSIVAMGELVLDVPSVIHALAAPYKDCIRKISETEAHNPFDFLNSHNIKPRYTIFTAAANNHNIAQAQQHDTGLQTQKRPLMQGMIKNAPFPLWAHLVGKSDKPVASITTHTAHEGTLMWYLGGGVAERKIDANPHDVLKAMKHAFAQYLPNIDFSKTRWSTLPINRIEGKSKTDSWMPDTPTIHKQDNVLYCWPTKLTFAPMLSDIIIEKIDIKPQLQSKKSILNDYSFLPPAIYAQTPWDNETQWHQWNT